MNLVTLHSHPNWTNASHRTVRTFSVIFIKLGVE